MTLYDALVHLPLLAWLATAALSCYGLFDCVSTLKPPPKVLWQPRIALIVPVRGTPTHFSALWNSICAQTLAVRRVIFAIENENDSAAQAIRFCSGLPQDVDVIVAGSTLGRAQKVHNLIAALDHLNEDDEVVVFADADIVPDKDWLLRLVTPLSQPEIKIVSGYRWMTPSDERWSSAFVCVANASIATAPRSPIWNLAWGGSIALRRDTLDDLNLVKVWDRAGQDDLSLTHASHKVGHQITCPQSLLVPSPTAMNWREAIAFGRRQYLFTRWSAPGHWALAAAATTLPIVGWSFALPLAFFESKIALATIVAVNVLDQIRASLRRRVSRILWGTEMPTRMAWLDRWGTPAWLTFHAMIIWSTFFGRSVRWAGRTYRINSCGNVVHIINSETGMMRQTSVETSSTCSSQEP